MATTIKSDTFRGLHALKELAGDKFHRGIVLYTGSNLIGFAEDLQAVPVSALWEITNGESPQLVEVHS